MGRSLMFPDPGSVMVSNPTYLASRELVLRLYNQDSEGETALNYCARVKDWFISESKLFGWSEALEVGNGLGILLHLKIALPSGPQHLALK